MIDFKTFLDKMKYVVQTMNEKWDGLKGDCRVGIITAVILVFLLLFLNKFLFMVTAVLGTQRIFYYGGKFKDEDIKIK